MRKLFNLNQKQHHEFAVTGNKVAHHLYGWPDGVKAHKGITLNVFQAQDCVFVSLYVQKLFTLKATATAIMPTTS